MQTLGLQRPVLICYRCNICGNDWVGDDRYSDARAVHEAQEMEDAIGLKQLQCATGNWKGPVSILPKLMYDQHQCHIVADMLLDTDK